MRVTDSLCSTPETQLCKSTTLQLFKKKKSIPTTGLNLNPISAFYQLLKLGKVT